MKRVEEILPRITEYLRNELAREKLSSVAERTRQFYVGRIEAALQQESDQLRVCQNGDAGDRSTHNSTPKAPILPSRQLSVSSSRLHCPDTDHTDLPGDIRALPVKSEKITVDSCKLSSQQLFDTYRNDFEPESNESDDSGTDYECYEEETNLYDQISPPSTVGGSLDSRKQSKGYRNYTRSIKTASMLETSDNLYIRSGALYYKGTLKMTKWYCILSGSSLTCFSRGKEAKPQLKIDLEGYEAVCMERVDKHLYHELRLACPGRDTYWFYSKELSSIKDWARDINKAATQSSPVLSGPPVPQRPTDVLLTSTSSSESGNQQCCNVPSVSGESVSVEGAERVQVTSLEKKLSITDTSKKTIFVMKTLKNTFGKKKGNKVDQKQTDASLYCDPDILISGHVYLSCNFGETGDSSGRKWMHRYCVIKPGRLEVYKNQSDNKIEFSVVLPGAQILLPGTDVKRHFVFKICQKQQEIFLDAGEVAEHGRWLNVLIRETGFAKKLIEQNKLNQLGHDDPESHAAYSDGGVYLYDEIRQYNDYIPDAYEEVRGSIDAAGYLEPDECRLLSSKKTQSALTNGNNVNVSDEIAGKAIKVCTSDEKQGNYHSMTKPTKPVCDATQQPQLDSYETGFTTSAHLSKTITNKKSSELSAALSKSSVISSVNCRPNVTVKLKSSENNSTNLQKCAKIIEGTANCSETAVKKGNIIKERMKMFETN